MSENNISRAGIASNSALRRLVTAFFDAGLNQVLNHDSVSIRGDKIVVAPLSLRDVFLIGNRLSDLANPPPVGRCINDSTAPTLFESAKESVMDETIEEHHYIPIGYSVALVKVT